MRSSPERKRCNHGLYICYNRYRSSHVFCATWGWTYSLGSVAYYQRSEKKGRSCEKSFCQTMDFQL